LPISDYPGYDKPGGGGETRTCGTGVPYINCPDYPLYDKPGGGGDTSNCGSGVPNINCPDYPGYDKPGGGGDTSYCDSVANVNCPDYPGYDKPGGGGDTSNCGDGVTNINCPDYPGYDKPGGGGDTSYCGGGVPNVNCPDYPGYDKPGGGGDTSYCGHGVPNINCPDYPGYTKPGGGGDTSYCGGVPNVSCPDYPGYTKPGGGGDTSYCGHGVLNINCPDYPSHDATDETVFSVAYSDASFKLSSGVSGSDQHWLSFDREIVTVDNRGKVSIAGVGTTHVLCYEPSGVGSNFSKVLVNVRVEVTPKPLDVEQPYIQLVKHYDKTDTVAFVSAGKMLGRLPQDDGKVFVKPTARYSDAIQGRNKMVVVRYRLEGSRAHCYVAPQNDTFYNGEILASAAVIPCLAWGKVVKQVIANGDTSYVPWGGIAIEYTVTTNEGKKLPLRVARSNENGVYYVDNLDIGDTVHLTPPPMYTYRYTQTNKNVVVTGNLVSAGTICYLQENITIAEVTFTDAARGKVLARWSRENINTLNDSTIFYHVPCGVTQLKVDYDVPSSGVFGECVSGNVDVSDTNNFQLNVSEFGEKFVTVQLKVADKELPKRFFFTLEKDFGLFDVVNEHIGSVRIVNNNPKFNRHKLIFKSCEWWQKREQDTSWCLVEEHLLYCTAGESIYDRFAPTDSMYLVLYTTDGDSVKTCVDVTHDKRYRDGGSAQGKLSPDPTIFPNPVLPGGTVKLRQSNLVDDEEYLHATLYLFDARGQLIRMSSASALYNSNGLIMPEIPGVYHLVLESADGRRRSIKIAVGGVVN
ncbi:MAG: T9SS type A sorting domain-containing protein, partial [Prevotellaceae bacterium]|nr:T9SS type A sorting domain-containing protein [Prevotellaceae bacterium]